MADLGTFVSGWEGFQPRAKWDYKQYSNGFGTVARSPDETIDRDEAKRRLNDELAKARVSVSAKYPNLSPNQSDALASFTYNLGPGWMNGPTKMNTAVAAGDWDAAAAVMRQYNMAGGKKLDGLERRRHAEAEMLLGVTDQIQQSPSQQPQEQQRAIQPMASIDKPEEEPSFLGSLASRLQSPLAQGGIGLLLGGMSGSRNPAQDFQSGFQGGLSAHQQMNEIALRRRKIAEQQEAKKALSNGLNSPTFESISPQERAMLATNPEMAGHIMGQIYSRRFDPDAASKTRLIDAQAAAAESNAKANRKQFMTIRRPDGSSGIVQLGEDGVTDVTPKYSDAPTRMQGGGPEPYVWEEELGQYVPNPLGQNAGPASPQPPSALPPPYATSSVLESQESRPVGSTQGRIGAPQYPPMPSGATPRQLRDWSNTIGQMQRNARVELRDAQAQKYDPNGVDPKTRSKRDLALDPRFQAWMSIQFPTIKLSANQAWHAKGGTIDLKDVGKKDAKEEDFAAVIDDVKAASFMLTGQVGDKVYPGQGYNQASRAIAFNSAGNLFPAAYQAKAALDHAVTVFGTLSRNATHANAVDVRNLQFFSPTSFDNAQAIGFKADQLHRMMTAYIGAGSNRGEVFKSALATSLEEAKKKFGADFLDKSIAHNSTQRAEPRQDQVRAQQDAFKPKGGNPGASRIPSKRVYDTATGTMKDVP